MQDSGLSSCSSNMIKLSVCETKWSSLLARTGAFILLFRFEYLISGPKSYRDFRETGPRPQSLKRVDNGIRWINLYPVDKAFGFPNHDLSAG